MRLHRLMAMVLLLESRAQVKAREFAQAFETSERTVYRDIETLCQAGIPIRSDFGPGGGFSLMEGYTASLNTLHCDEIISLYLSGIGVRPNSYSQSSLNLNNALMKLEGTLPRQYQPDITKARERFFFDPEMWFKESLPLEHFDILRRAVWQSLVLDLDYMKSQRHKNQGGRRRVRPYGLVVKDGDWYLVAWCEERRDIRVFRCDRISEAVIQEGADFTVPPDFNLEVFWQKWVRQFVQEVNSSDPGGYPVEFRVLSPDFRLGDYDVLAKSGDSITVELHSFENARNTVLGLGESIEVLGPMELRDYVIQRAGNILEIYSEKG